MQTKLQVWVTIIHSKVTSLDAIVFSLKLKSFKTLLQFFLKIFFEILFEIFLRDFFSSNLGSVWIDLVVYQV